ncbi:hypothetical protein [Streptomyces sp. NPDC003688]
MGRRGDIPRCPTNFEVGCACRMCDPRWPERARAQGNHTETETPEVKPWSYGHTFQGQPAKVTRSGGTINVLYGGQYSADGPGHGHVKATGGILGDNITFWRLPASEGGAIIVSNSLDVMYGNDLNDYLS